MTFLACKTGFSFQSKNAFRINYELIVNTEIIRIDWKVENNKLRQGFTLHRLTQLFRNNEL